MAKRQGKGRVVRIVLGIVLLVVAAGGVAYLMRDYIHMQQNANVQAEVAKEVTVVPEEPEPEAEESFVYDIDENLLRTIDFDSLKARNSDVETWMYVPGTGIDAYVMREPYVGQYRYDLRGLDREYNGCGSFLLPAEPDGADDAHQLLLGHRMISYNGTEDWQFSMLPVRWGDADGVAEYPYVYLYYPDHSERWLVWCAVDAWWDDAIYQIPYELGADDYEQLLSHTADISRYQVGRTPDKWTRTLYLSTCNRPNGGALMRFCLVLVPDVRYYYDTGELVWCDDEQSMRAWQMRNGESEQTALDAISEQVREVALTPTSPLVDNDGGRDVVLDDVERGEGA